jgi:hypothetical protein
MTTGRINQVTTVPGRPREGPAGPAARRLRSNCTLIRVPKHPARGTREQRLHRATHAIHLPPLSFPQAGPPHRDDAPGRGPVVCNI